MKKQNKSQKLVIGGIYKHFKGTKVKVIGKVLHSETLEIMVHYIHLTDGVEWVRPNDMFLGEKEPGVYRFKLIRNNVVKSLNESKNQ